MLGQTTLKEEQRERNHSRQLWFPPSKVQCVRDIETVVLQRTTNHRHERFEERMGVADAAVLGVDTASGEVHTKCWKTDGETPCELRVLGVVESDLAT